MNFGRYPVGWDVHLANGLGPLQIMSSDYLDSSPSEWCYLLRYPNGDRVWTNANECLTYVPDGGDLLRHAPPHIRYQVGSRVKLDTGLVVTIIAHYPYGDVSVLFGASRVVRLSWRKIIGEAGDDASSVPPPPPRVRNADRGVKASSSAVRVARRDVRKVRPAVSVRPVNPDGRYSGSDSP